MLSSWIFIKSKNQFLNSDEKFGDLNAGCSFESWLIVPFLLKKNIPLNIVRLLWNESEYIPICSKICFWYLYTSTIDFVCKRMVIKNDSSTSVTPNVTPEPWYFSLWWIFCIKRPQLSKNKNSGPMMICSQPISSIRLTTPRIVFSECRRRFEMSHRRRPHLLCSKLL